MISILVGLLADELHAEADAEHGRTRFNPLAQGFAQPGT